VGPQEHFIFMSEKEIVNEIRGSATKDAEFSRELGIKFFFQWALLSGAALTLFIPFLTSEIFQINISSYVVLFGHISVAAFLSSLFFSSLRNFLMMNAILRSSQFKHTIANDLSKAIENNKNYQSPPQPGGQTFRIIIGYIAVLSFLVGIISSYIVISKVIF